MIDSLYIAATGMQAQQLNVDMISNNLANVNTVGFKKNRASFEDLMYREVTRTGKLLQRGDIAQRVGVGAAVVSTDKIFTTGDLKKTEAPLDLAIRGQGFFEVTLPNGNHAYMRSGSLQINKDGFLATTDGLLINPAVQIPTDATDLTIETSGRILAKVPNEVDKIEVGQIELANFVNPSGLNAIGDNLYLPTEKSGDAFFGKPGEDNFGTVAQGFLESSNVKLVEEMINLIVAQRAYEVNSKAIQASDEMLSMSNNLRR